ncbi:Acg family FMN-binding oxidoreductase [Nocardia farcinica]|uniref:Acg family FMN-binding oxidoreductase n=1 Tax=Nocardia farcinica TaxID=37329 RepID=UPI001895368A|nr:NAD(P)H nitroreductase [Nocardia farcinica]MBF6235025.1 NAD(P)H nitroreductase [Nocardia farcinica]MBF6445322.1 NAD(P)H nitroreductase [Nocardia farcinica]
MSAPHPDSATVRAALALALRAPSVHNTQPWRWRTGDRSVHLFADESRTLPTADPDQRELLLSCGTALHHFRVAARSLGWRTIVHRYPNTADPAHLAAIEFAPVAPSADIEELARAVNRRRTDRRAFTSWEVPDGYVAAMIAAGSEQGAAVLEVGDESAARVRAAFARAGAEHHGDLGYRVELAMWSGRHAAAEGVPARNAVTSTDPMTRQFSAGTLAEAVVHDRTGGRMLLVHTATDDPAAWLRAGEATSAALLTATTYGLATCPLTEPFEISGTRDALREAVLGGSGFPQLLIRTGWAATSAKPVPITPRRALAEVVGPLDV